MSNYSTLSLSTSPFLPQKAFSNQHNVWNKLLLQAEKRAPQLESHLYLPRDPGDDHLRASFEDFLINHQLQIDAVFRIPIQEPIRPKRKAAKRCRPRQSTIQAQKSRIPSISRVPADDEGSEVVFVGEVLASRKSMARSAIESDDFVLTGEKKSGPSELGSDIPLAKRLQNDQYLYSELGVKPSAPYIVTPQHAPERSRRRVSKSTPLSTMQNPLSSLEPSEYSMSLYSCDSRVVASRAEPTLNACGEATRDPRVKDYSSDIVPVVCTPQKGVSPKRANRVQMRTIFRKSSNSDVESDDFPLDLITDACKGNDGDRVGRSRHGSTEGLEICSTSIFSSFVHDIAKSELSRSHRPRYAFRKTVQSISTTPDDDDEQDTSESGIVALPLNNEETSPTTSIPSQIENFKGNDVKRRHEADAGEASGCRNEEGMLSTPKPRYVRTENSRKRTERKDSTRLQRSSRTRKSKRASKLPDLLVLNSGLRNTGIRGNRKRKMMKEARRGINKSYAEYLCLQNTLGK
ncbi:unnamed protein product [Agarophyton chilense]